MHNYHIHNYLLKFIISTNILVVVGLWITGFLSGLNPEEWGWLSLIGYAFPFFIIATILFLIPWLFLKKRYILISLVGLLLAYYPVTLYCPINFVKEKIPLHNVNTEEDILKVMSYNVCNWGIGYNNNDITIENISDEDKYQIMMDYFKSINADIVAIQEGKLNEHIDSLKNIYIYSDTVHSVGDNECAVLLLSKYPILRKQNLNIPSKGNGAGAFWINFKGTEIIVVATHLQTMGLSVDEKEKFSTMVHGDNDNTDSVKNTSKTIFGKILIASKKRTKQAQIISQFINSHISSISSNKNSEKGYILVMGDFNDIPQSYTHDIICDQLKDCYKEKGLGPGYSYSHFGMRVRIDNILCSENFNPLSCYVDKNLDLSDHFPIIATLKIKK